MTEPVYDDPQDRAMPMPRQLVLVDDVFRFSFAEAQKVLRDLGSGADLLITLEDVVGFVQNADLPPDEKATVSSLINDEIEVIAFSQAARSSVIRF